MRGGVFPQIPFNQQVSLPCELTLRRTAAGIRLFRSPAHEIDVLEGKRHDLGSRRLAEGDVWPTDLAHPLLRIRMQLDLAETATVVLSICGSTIVVDHRSIAIGDVVQPTHTAVRSLEIVVDLASVEVFANDGEASLTAFAFAGQPQVEVRARGGVAVVAELSVTELASIWDGVSSVDDRRMSRPVGVDRSSRRS